MAVCAARWSWWLAPRWLGVLPLVVAAVIFTTHWHGYKLDGGPKLVETRPLSPRHPLEASGWEPPNLILATDGSRHVLRGFTFAPDALALSRERQKEILKHIGGPLRFLPDPTMPSGYVTESRCLYKCGNTWFAGFLPVRLPSHQTSDLALALRHLGSEP